VSRDTVPGSGSTHHEFDWSDQAVIDAFAESIRRCGEMGIPEYQFIDAVWQYNGKAGFDIGSLDWRYGNWGFNDKTISNFRLALNEKDKGIKFGKYGTEGKTVHFHEYVKFTTGVTLKPEDLGLKTWDEYVPCVNGFSMKDEEEAWKEKTGSEYDHLNFFVSFMLRHYEWLKLFGEVGEEGVKAGCDVVAMPYGSNWANGNDIDGTIKLANVKVLIDETRFYRPTLILSGYAELPVWRDMINKYDKHLRLICEVGMGGGANIYFDPLFSYIKNYSLTSTAHYDSMQCDWVWGGVNENSDKLGFEAFEDFLFKAWGFNAATEDKGQRSNDCKRAIRLVTPYCVYVNSPLSNVVAERFKSTFKYSFYNSTFPYEIMNFSEYKDLDPNCDLMVVDTVNMPQETADMIQDKAMSRKMTVLLGAYSAGSEADGINFNNCWGKENKAKLDKPLGMNEETRKLIDRDLFLSEHINKYNLFGRFLKGVFSDGIQTIKGNIQGIDIDYKGEYYFITKDNAKPVLSLDGKPILSLITLDNGSEVYYYHINAGVCQALDDYVLSIVYNSAGIKPEGETENAYLERWTMPNGCEAVSLFSKSSFAKYAGPPIRWDYLDINDKDSVSRAVIETKVKGDYVIFDFINNTVLDNQKGKTVTLDMIGKSANLYYIIPKAKSEEMIKTLKERREKLDYWENLRNEKFYNGKR
ncbi:MAG: hypothetical protein KBT47_07620, partial [Armatimonadetes bacterium]|nr:hypothetical protein [Candidatus Hippobium faecium]